MPLLTDIAVTVPAPDDTVLGDDSGTTARYKVANLGPHINVFRFLSDAQIADVVAGTGSLELTTAIQAAITYVETIDYAGVEQEGRPQLFFPSGVYMSDGVTCTQNITIVGSGSCSTFWKLKTGSTSSLITLNAENTAGTSLDDTNHPVISGMRLMGNRTDLTPGTSYGIDCPATAWTITTQYSTSFRANDLVLEGFTGDGVFLGANRNWAIWDGVIVRYCNRNAFSNYGFDHHIVNSSFGECVTNGVKGYAGGTVSFTNCAIWGNANNVDISSSVTGPYQFFGGSIDSADERGIYCNKPDMLVVKGTVFTKNSTTTANTYSDIVLDGAGIANVDSDHKYATQQVKYLVEFANGATMVGTPRYQTTGTAPFGTAFTNDYPAIRYTGTSQAYIGQAGANTLSGYVGSTEIWRQDADYLRVYKTQRIESANPAVILAESGVAANTGKWLLNINGGVLTLSAMDDAETGFGTVFTINRSGTTVTAFSSNVPFGLPSYTVGTLPTASSWGGRIIYVSDGTSNKRLAVSDGTNWRFPDGAIVS